LGDVRVSPAGSRAERIADGYIQYTPEIAAYWDSYVDWDKRRAGEGDFFINVLKHHNVARVLDAACGTGYDSVRLLEAGFQVTSCDGSLFMLTKARINAEEHGLAIEARFCDWRRLARSYDETFDAVVFLGNSFSHLFEVRERLAVLRQIHTLLEADGVFIIDQRNYDLVLAHGFPDHHRYVYAGDGWHSQILEKTDDHLRCLYGRDAFRFEMDIYPIRVGEMVELLTQAGFVVETFGDFATHSKNADVEFFQHVCTKR
jgi:SAM-dependent methyltransferase